MKKSVCAILCVLLTVCTFFCITSCKNSDGIVVAVPDGGPALGMALLIKDYGKINGTKVTYKIVDGSNGIKSAVISGEADIAIMPTNMAAILYNQGVSIKHVGNNSYGLLYLLSNVTAESFNLDNLVGSVLYNVGQGGTPDVAVKMILSAAQIAYTESDTPVSGKVALAYADAQTIIAKLKTGAAHYAVLGEPVVSTALVKCSDLFVAMDVQSAWQTATESAVPGYPQTSLVAKSSLIKTDSALVKKVAELTVQNAQMLKTEGVSSLIAALKAKGATVPDALTAAGVLRANIAPKFGEAAKADVNDYLGKIATFNKALVGGKLPDDGFYYNIM